MKYPLGFIITFLLLLGAPALSQKKGKVPAAGLPEVGRIAPPLGALSWMQLGGKGRAETSLLALRRKVVIVADYGYYCDSCLRAGIPELKALCNSNDAKDLATILLTVGIGDDTNELIRKKGEELGLAGPLAVTDVDGEGTPYLDMGRLGNLTYAHVIGRQGGIVWRGDPSRKREEYVAAVTQALHAVPCAALPAPEAFGEALAPALADYVLGDFQKAEAQVQALQKKNGTKSGAEADKLRAEAADLLALVESTRKQLLDELVHSAESKDAERIARALQNVRRAFPKGPESVRANELETALMAQGDAAVEVRRWSAWLALEAARPANFPAEKDASGIKFAHELGKYVKLEGAVALDEARGWLDAFAKAVERK